MGRTFQRAQRMRQERAEAIDEGKRTSNLLTAGLLGILAAGITVVALVLLSPLGILGGLLALLSPWAWMRGDRARVDEIAPEHQRAYAAETGWSLLSVACLAGGYALVITALIHGW